jgi:hypothetical protein
MESTRFAASRLRRISWIAVRRQMLEPAMVMAAILLGATLPAIPAPRHLQRTDTQRSLNLVGEIMDRRCAIDGAHDKMTRQNGTKNASIARCNAPRRVGPLFSSLRKPRRCTNWMISRNRRGSPGSGFASPAPTTSRRGTMIPLYEVQR